jgi:hypothetical protein
MQDRAMLRPSRVAPLAAAVLGALLSWTPLPALATASAGGIAADETVDAVWRIQRFDFTYHSSTVYYSCRALQAKIGAILRAVGAHHRVAVDVHCMGGDFVRFAYVRVTLAVPAEATQATVTAATTFDTRAQLVARLRKLPLPTAVDIERFPAEWRTVSLSGHRSLRLDSGDCDLLRGMREQIFPKLSVRVARDGLRCTPGATTRIRPKLVVTALMPAPAPLPDRPIS